MYNGVTDTAKAYYTCVADTAVAYFTGKAVGRGDSVTRRD